MRVLSSPYTALYKYGPLATGVTATLLIVVPLLRVARTGQEWAIVLLASASVTALLWLFTADIKRVALGDGKLMISDFRNEVAVPLAEVASVRLRRIPMPPVVEIMLKHRVLGSRRLVFFPVDPYDWLAGEGEAVAAFESALADAGVRPA